ncbi:MAG TPA: acyl-CoA dehydrogenase, partial [Jatrophihabitans sp.]|nr:acyl-CoA dehydrogenase [Jatrophihabitans sp.]
ITTTARRDGSDWVLNGRKIYVSGVDNAQAILIVARTEDAKTGRLKPALFAFPTDTPGFEYKAIDMDVVMPDKQFLLFLDDVRLPADALVGEEDAALAQLFAGLNPERIMAAAGSVGMGRYALDRAVRYANERSVWGKPIGTHQGLSHPLAKAKVELELAKLMMQKAASLYDEGDDMGAGESANMAKYAAAEASIACVDQAVQTLGGNGFAHEYGVGALLLAARVARVAPVSREMILNFVAQFSLGLPKSY